MPIDIDSLYDVFCAALPPESRAVALALAYELKLAPAPDLPWSAVFKHEVTLGAPALIAENMHGAESRATERAVLAHMLAVIEAFGTDRIADEQVAGSPELAEVLRLARTARDAALFEIGGADAKRMAEQADRQTREAIATERLLLARGEPVDFGTYESVSAGKQAVGLPASLVLARTAALHGPKLETVRETLMGIWLGLQFQDDVADWEDDVTRGGAWAVLLARRVLPAALNPSAFPNLRELVLSSGVLASMLGLSAGRFRTALAGAESLGAERLSAWLRARSAEALDLCEKEGRSPGYFGRLKALAPWAAEVLT